MAEDYAETQAATTEASPDTGNDGSEGYESGSEDTTSSTATETPDRSPEPWREQGYESLDDLLSHHTRYKQQVVGSQQEFQRIRGELAQTQQRLREYEAWQRQQASNGQGQGQGQTTAPQDLTIEHAFEAYLNNDRETLARYQQQEQIRSESRAQQKVLETLHTVVKPAQYSDALMRQYPELNDPASPLYRAVYQRYDAEAADPMYRLLFPQEEYEAYRDAYSPDGVETKRVDMRIVNVLAHKVAADLARQGGRIEEARRRGAAGGNDPTSNRRRDTQGDPAGWDLMSAKDRDEITNALRQRALPDEWGKTPQAVANYRVKGWKQRGDPKYKSRLEQFRAGMPIRDE
jgi:hypothetical protein